MTTSTSCKKWQLFFHTLSASQIVPAVKSLIEKNNVTRRSLEDWGDIYNSIPFRIVDDSSEGDDNFEEDVLREDAIDEARDLVSVFIESNFSIS